MNTRSRLTLPPPSPAQPQRASHDIRLRMEVERTRLGRALVEQSLLTLELRQPPVNVAEQRFWSRQTFFRLVDLAFAIIQGLRGILQMLRRPEQGF